MAEFRVVIEGLTLDAKATKAINDSIQRVVLDQLAGFDLTTKKQAVVAFRPHPDWYGLVAQILKRGDVVALPAVQKTVKGLGGPDT